MFRFNKRVNLVTCSGCGAESANWAK